ncbi:MAG: class II D-tagatose-bisphosphate aldolase, non-catalytic subunit [Candidatus Sulfotelmatobacter sp.]
MEEKTNPVEMDRPTLAQGPSEYLRSVVQRNRSGEAVGSYAVCSAHPAVIDAAIQQTLEDGNCLHVESTSSQVNQFGGYTDMTPQQFADSIRATAASAGLPAARVLLGADHLGPFAWRSEPAATAMAKACDLARLCVHAGYQKIHLDTSMSCGDDAKVLDEKTVAERAAILCRAAEQACEEMPTGWPRPLYVVGTEVPAPGGEVAEGECPAPTKVEDVHRTLDIFRSAFRAHGLLAAWENVVGLVVQPAVEFGDAKVFDYDRQKVCALSAGLPASPELSYEAHSTDYQSPAALAEMVQDHFAILKVGPWLTFAYREAIFALGSIEREILGHKREVKLSQVWEALESEMLRNPAYWRSYYRGDDDELRLSRAFSFSDRCRYYWPQPSVQEEVKRLLQNLDRFSCPLTLLSEYLPIEYEAIREGALENDAAAIIGHHIRRVLRFYAAACGNRVTRRAFD